VVTDMYCTKESVAVFPVYERDVPFFLFVSDAIHTTNCKRTQALTNPVSLTILHRVTASGYYSYMKAS